MLAIVCWMSALLGPPLSLPDGFPSKEGARYGYRLTDAYADWIDFGPGGENMRPEVFECLMADARYRRRVWSRLLDACVAASLPLEDQINLKPHTNGLRAELGWEDFYAGRMPSPVPGVR